MTNWDLREFRVQVNWLSPIRQVRMLIWRVITPIRGLPHPIWQVVPLISHTSASTLVSVRNTRVFQTALTALTEHCTLWRRNTRFPSPCIHTSPRAYWTDVVAFRCTWEHLGAHWITVEQSGKNIFFGNAAGALVNYSYCLSFNNFQNLCLLFVFSPMYLWIYIATYLQTLYLDWQHPVIGINSGCAWRTRSTELRDTLRSCNWASVEMDLQAVIELVWRCTWRPRANGLKDAFGGHHRASLEMHLEAGMEWTQRCTGRQCTSECGDALWGCDWTSLEVQLETEMVWTQRFTGRPWSSEFGHALGAWHRVTSEMHSELWASQVREELAAGYDRWRLEEYLEVVNPEAVNGRRAGCWDSIHRLVNLKPWQWGEVILPLKLVWNLENEGTTDNLRCILNSVYAALGVCCTRCMLHSVYAAFGICCIWCMLHLVYAAFGVCCIWCMLHLVYAALGVNSWWRHGEIARDNLTLCSWNDGRVVDGKVRDEGWRWERDGGYERTWEIRGSTCYLGLRRPRIGVNTRWIGTCPCHIGDCKLTHTWNSLKSQFLMMISPISPDFSLSCAQLYHHLRTQS